MASKDWVPWIRRRRLPLLWPMDGLIRRRLIHATPLYALLGIAFLVDAAAGASPVDVTVSLDPPIIPFHRQAEYKISVDAPDGVDVKFPQMISTEKDKAAGKDKFAGLGVADLRRDTKPLKGNRRRTTETYVLDPILVGVYRIYPAEVKWDDQSVTVPSPALRVRDLTDQEKEEAMQFADIEGPLPIKGWFAKHWKGTTSIAGLVLSAAAVAMYLYRRRQKQAEAVPAPPPWEMAYQRLRELDQRQLPKAGQYEAFYVDLSAILRRYIEERFSLHAPEQTTPEFLAAASGSHLFTDDQQKLLSQFLRHSDYVKFAQYIPSVNEMERCFAFVLQFVDDTIPKPAPEEKEMAA